MGETSGSLLVPIVVETRGLRKAATALDYEAPPIDEMVAKSDQNLALE
jgi:hypothetical protein